MGWINDVAPFDTIQSLWGNTIRDRVILDYGSKAERDSHTTHDGQVCYTADTGIYYVRVGGQWWVLAMPYRPFTPRVWIVDVDVSGGVTEQPISQTLYARWAQSMGRAHVSASYIVGTSGPFNVNVNARVFVPVPCADSGQQGYLHCFVNATGKVHGGGSIWTVNLGTGSAVTVTNVGAGVDPNARFFITSGNANFSVEQNQIYRCPPTADTP